MGSYGGIFQEMEVYDEDFCGMEFAGLDVWCSAAERIGESSLSQQKCLCGGALTIELNFFSGFLKDGLFNMFQTQMTPGERREQQKNEVALHWFLELPLLKVCINRISLSSLVI
ncbi:unnamed protein product [Fraxinus pennsylvanica]|uniref:Uncharacterized protein n=1 Tax=Fraxinus pennsylvanica TaxID=56036 RepID=A0AAD2DKW6_9LAMI|nr:unnamed protein product [Fraxinus pennsylvanica]